MITDPYTDDIPAYGSLMTRKEYEGTVASRFFTDYDGHGRPVKDGKMAGSLLVVPSKCPGDIPADATHIMWFNR